MGATLTFDDEFNNLSLWNGSTGTWDTTFAYRPQGSNGASLAGNGEQEWYINADYAPTSAVHPWTVSNGVLTLTAAKVAPSIAPLLGFSDPGMPGLGSYQYTSGMIETNHSFSQTYGYFEMKAQLPSGQGFWPAFWLVRADGSWPPELDVMEVLGKSPNTLYTTVHTNETGSHTQSGLGSVVGDMSTGFHTFAVDWERDKITWYFDNRPVFQAATPSDMNAPMFMIANLAVGGYWPGNADGTTQFPGQMAIDYIKAWTSNPYSYTPESSTGTGSAFNAVANSAVVGTGGDDLFTGSIAGGETLTGGGGHDTFIYTSIPWVGDTITDFRVGSDKLDLHALIPTYSGSDPIADGYVVVAANGEGGYNVLVNPDGHATAAHPYPTLVAKLSGVTSVGLTSANLLVDGAKGQTAASTFSTHNTFQVTADGAAVAAPLAPPPPITVPAPPAPTTSFIGTAGADTLTATTAGGETMTGAAGADVFAFKTVPWVGDHVSDFTPGQDRLDFSALFAASHYVGSDPLADGFVKLVDDATGVWVRFDTDGAGTNDAWGTNVVHLDGLAAAALSSAKLFGFAAATSPPAASPPPVLSPPPASPPAASPPPVSPPPVTTGGLHLTGQTQADVLSGTVGSDTITASAQGQETITGHGGGDTYVFGSVPWVTDHITDFTPGSDRLDVSALLSAHGYSGADPIADKYILLFDDGAGGTLVRFDSDGVGAADPWGTNVVDLDHVAPSAVTLASLAWTTGSAATPSPAPVAASPAPPPVSPPPVSPPPVAASPSPASPAVTTSTAALTPDQVASAAHDVLRLDWTAAATVGAASAAAAPTLAQETAQILHAASAATSVATLAYEFFTGATPSAAGLDYLVAANGPNPNNLNSAYYQGFNLENRYINFAVNLGQAGAGASQFAAGYGGLDLFEATRKAYAAVFGAAPTDAKIHVLLDSLVAVGTNQDSRADYFAMLGHDSPNGLGTKAAMVGWLMAEAVKADVGSYALANDAYLTDVAFHHGAIGVDLLAVYGKPEHAYLGG